MIILLNKLVTYLLLIGLLFTILSVNIPFSKADASPIEWNKTYGGPGDERASCMIKTNDSNYVIAGSTTSYGAGKTDFWLIKIDENGNLLWDKTYGGIEGDGASSVIQTNDGGYALGWTTFSLGYQVMWLIKTDSEGNIQWNKTGLTMPPLLPPYGVMGISSMVQTNDGGYAILGRTNTPGYIPILVKLDSSGNPLWYVLLPRGSRDTPDYRCMILTNDGGFGLIGTESFGAEPRDRLFFDILDSNGTRIGGFSGTLHFPDSSYDTSEGYAAVQTYDGGYTLLGQASGGIGQYPNRVSYSYLWLIKLDSTGKMVWNTPCVSALASIYLSAPTIQTKDGGYAFAPTPYSSLGVPNDFLLVKTDSAGNFLWNKTFGGAGNDNVCSVIETSDGGFLLAGSTNSFGSGGYDFWVVKTASVLTSTPTLTVLNSENGTIYPSPGTYIPSELGDDAAWLIAHPDSGYKFSHFLIDGIQTSAQYIEPDGDYTYYLKTDTSHVVQAVFTVYNPVFPTLTVLDSPGGTIYPSPGMYFPAELGGNAAWLIAHPNSGYSFKYFVIDGVVTSNQYFEEDGDYTYYLALNTSHTVQAIFAPAS